MKTARNIAIVIAGGEGKRFGDKLPKQYHDLGGRPVMTYCLDLFERSDMINEVVLVVSEDYLVYASREIVDKFGYRKVKKITTGGESRQESVHAGLTACPTGIDLVVIHDAVRPFLAKDLLHEAIKTANATGAAILAVPAKESVKLVRGKSIEKTLLRDTVWIAQTPQVFRFDGILEAHNRAEAAENEATDDSQLYEQYCGEVSIVRGSYNNIKITSRGDLVLAEEILREIG
ncbi:MAG: 2-C-methyl-D-erythritol 4-phosphate cytidylyltransferase [Candidatus Zixiibacteriota bacterium]|nr:MAG: 2-C-methyl-D-erythritol 4-phosphate cytidylyltransferase [candidate division Zixibacteria bacterium]